MRVLKQRILKRRILKQRFVSDKTSAERIKLFLSLFKLLGLFANNVTTGRLKRCSWPVYGICAFWIGMYVSTMSYLFIGCVTADFMSIHIILHYTKYFIAYISFIADTINAYSSQNHFSKFFDRLDSYDHEVARMKKKRRDNLWIPWIVMFLMIFLASCFIFAMHLTQPRLTRPYSKVILFSETYIIIIHMYSFLEKFLMLYLILKRCKHLNEKIAPNVSWDEERRKPNAIKISDVKILHSMLCDAHKIFNDIYRNVLLLSFAALMLRIVANLFLFRTENTLTAIFSITPSIFLMFLICIICHYTAEEANNIACVLSKGMTTLISSGKTTAKIDTLTYFLHNRMSFDAAGFFTIDLPLFQSIIAAISSYFIILV